MLSKTSIHAVRAAILLARLEPGEYAGTGKLAKEIGAPPNYLGKLLQQLAKAGVLKSQKGITGGFALATSPERVSLLEIVEPLEQISRWNQCILGTDKCSSDKPCPLHERFGEVRDQYLDMLRETTLASIRELPF